MILYISSQDVKLRQSQSQATQSGEQMQVISGALRERDVIVGKHIPVRPGALPRQKKYAPTLCRKKAGRILEAILCRGELPRGDVPELLEASDRHSRRVVATLIERGVVVSASARPATPCLPRQAGITLDAGTISRATLERTTPRLPVIGVADASD